MNIRLATLTAVMLLVAPLARAEAPSQTTFPSAEAASRALFMAVKNHDEAAIVQILGAPQTPEERRDEERLEHEQFAQKYEQMHRLARERKGQGQEPRRRDVGGDRRRGRTPVRRRADSGARNRPRSRPVSRR